MMTPEEIADWHRTHPPFERDREKGTTTFYWDRLYYPEAHDLGLLMRRIRARVDGMDDYDVSLG